LVSSSNSSVLEAPLFALLLVGVLAPFSEAEDVAAAFLLDLGVLRIFSGSSSMGFNNPLLRIALGAVFSSPPDSSSTLTGVTTLPALEDLVLLWGRSSLA